MLKMLNTSVRNSIFIDSLTANFFAKIRSCWTNLGPCIWLRTRLPKVPGLGIAKAAGLRIVRSLLINGLAPGIRSGRRTLRELPPPGVLITAVPPAAGLPKMPAASTYKDVRAGYLHGDRESAARIQDRSNVPSSQQEFADTGESPAPRQRIDTADIERMAYVEVVVAVVVIEVSVLRAMLPAVVASFEPAVLPKLRPKVYCELSVRPLLKRRPSVI